MTVALSRSTMAGVMRGAGGRPIEDRIKEEGDEEESEHQGNKS